MKQFLILLLLTSLTVSFLEEKEALNSNIESKKSDIIIPTSNGNSLRVSIADGSNQVINTSQYTTSHHSERSQRSYIHLRHRHTQISRDSLITSSMLQNCPPVAGAIGGISTSMVTNILNDLTPPAGTTPTGPFTLHADQLQTLLCIFSQFNEYVQTIVTVTFTPPTYYNETGQLCTGDSYLDSELRCIGINPCKDANNIIYQPYGSYDATGKLTPLVSTRARRTHISKHLLRRVAARIQNRNRRNRSNHHSNQGYFERKLSVDGKELKRN